MEVILGGSQYEQYVLNEKNKYITKKFIESILKDNNLNHKVVNLENFQHAMIHKSYLKSTVLTEKIIKLLKEIPPTKKSSIPLQENSYESLEFLGDAVLHNILAQYLYKRYNNKDPGFLTVLRTKLEKGTTLNVLSRAIGFHDYAIIAKNIEIAGGRENNVNIMEDVFEAFIGALSLECKFEECAMFVITLIEKHIDFADLINTADNYKEILMQYYHKVGYKTTPTYKLINTTDDKKKIFTMAAYDPNNKLIGTGEGVSKVLAAQLAANNALIKLKVINNKIDDDSDDDEIYAEE